MRSNNVHIQLLRESKSKSLKTILDAVFVPGGAFRFKRKLDEIAPERYSQRDGFIERNYGSFMASAMELIKTIGYVSIGYSLFQ